ncbi:VOC family protein [Actinotalea sp. M2MS4P-6]|uniref:VOC family protein n=1 Tax=Actinotalea sp. M2MS4P-6 TaxID=2983762 RepID=UPI0021E4E450|nr:VOC family protein [Actinotalea sp. M2MS4P-6]MCV2393235.1 VOC family protein [Actinotalea sp. M2MS4P-6]
MAIVIGHLNIDSTDPLPLARWWADVLGWQVDEDDEDEVWVAAPQGEGVGRTGPGTGGLLFIRVPEAKSVKNRLHLDLRPADGTDQETELARLLALGATTVDVGQGDVPWHVLADPQGNEFCLLRSTPSRLAELLAAQE